MFGHLIYGIGIIWFFVIFWSEELFFLSGVLFSIFIRYYGINLVGIFPQNRRAPAQERVNDSSFSKSASKESQTKTNKTTRESYIKYKKSGLTENNAKNIHNILSQKMEDELLYVNPELTLVQLAHILDVHPNNLSQVINTYEEKNFYEYINSKRIEMFKKRIKSHDNKKFTILSLAFDCGFNSKSSFNKYFKKDINLTPTEYIKTNIIS